MSSAKSPMTRLALAAAIGAAALVSAPPSGAQGTDLTAIESPPPAAIVAGEVIVKLRPGTSEQSRDLVLAVVNAVFVRSLDLSDLILARVPVGTEIAAAASLEVDPNVVYAEPNGIMQGDASAAE